MSTDDAEYLEYRAAVADWLDRLRVMSVKANDALNRVGPWYWEEVDDCLADIIDLVDSGPPVRTEKGSH